MKPPPVHILVTIRKPDLLPAAMMVFKSIRVGFPTAQINAYWNGWPQMVNDKDSAELLSCFSAVKNICDKNGVVSSHIHTRSGVTHHQWIDCLLKYNTEPFIICDTDVTFWESMEGVEWEGPIMGRYIPQFRCKFVGAITLPRLHTSLLYFDPSMIREKVAEYFSQFPDTYCTPRPNLIYPQYVPGIPWIARAEPETSFYDTCSMLYHAIRGWPFTVQQLDRYDHLGFGTLSDLVAPHYPEMSFREEHFAIFDNPDLMRGRWKRDEEFYKANKV